jgi:hypothetical protein
LADVLERRGETLAERLADLEAEMHHFGPGLPRITLLETEYQRTLTNAELEWLRGIVEELRTGTFTWTEEQFATQPGSWEEQG